MDLHPSQRRSSCESCRKSKAKCQRTQPDDLRCVRCALANTLCHVGQQRKVGRPKQRAPGSPTDVVGHHVAKRRKVRTQARSQSAINKQPRHHGGTFKPALPDCFDAHEASMQVRNVQEAAPENNVSAQSVMSSSNPMTSGLEWQGSPTMLTNYGYHSLLPGDSRGYIVPDLDLDSAQEAEAGHPAVPSSRQSPPRTAVFRAFSALPEVLDSTRFQDLHSPFSPNLWLDARLAPNHLVATSTLPFGIGRPATFYVHENGFSSDPQAAFPSDLVVNGPGAMARLFDIIRGLQLRSTMVKTTQDQMSLSLLIHRDGPLFIGTYSLAEYVTSSAQELEYIVASLTHSLPGFPADEQSLACFTPIITDVYCRLLSFFQFSLEYLTDRAERYSTEPVIPIPGLTFNGMAVTGPCTQGTLFSSTVYYLLGRLESSLGLSSASEAGLLCTKQIDVLYSILDASDDLSQSKGIMRPSDLKELYAQVSNVMERLSAMEWRSASGNSPFNSTSLLRATV